MSKILNEKKIFILFGEVFILFVVNDDLTKCSWLKNFTNLSKAPLKHRQILERGCESAPFNPADHLSGCQTKEVYDMKAFIGTHVSNN